MIESFNVLTDAWIPLDDGKGAASYASYVELMTGDRDAGDLVHPRDDCRFYARMLLSALTQALFPPADARQLRERMLTHLGRDEVMARVSAVKADFDLLEGREPWMQATQSQEDSRDNNTRDLMLDNGKHLLFRPAVEPRGICSACAVVLVYGLQSFAPAGGRGYSPGVRGTPPITTLVVLPDSVRRTAWANTLHAQAAESVVYGPELPRPWTCQTDSKDGSLIGLVEGLFWKPRALRLTRSGVGMCAACARQEDLLAATGLRARQKRDGGTYRHPMSPAVIRQKAKGPGEMRYRNLSGDRPAWTGLVDWLTVVQRGTTTREQTLPAPVVAQWFGLNHPDRANLVVLDYAASKASILHRVVETFPLSLRIASTDVADAVRASIETAEKALDLLRSACIRLHLKSRPSEQLRGPRRNRERKEKDMLHEPTAAFWQGTEPAFWSVYEAAVEGDVDAQIRATDELQRTVCSTARSLFDAWASPSIADPSRLAFTSVIRAWLVKQLPWPERAG